MISYDRTAKKFILRQFHVEGCVNHYLQEASAKTAARWYFDEFTDTFELAEPGKEFTVYSETRFTRKR